MPAQTRELRYRGIPDEWLHRMVGPLAWNGRGRPPAFVTRARRAAYAELLAEDHAAGVTPRAHAHAATVGLKPEAALRLLEDTGFGELVDTIAASLAARAA